MLVDTRKQKVASSDSRIEFLYLLEKGLGTERPSRPPLLSSLSKQSSQRGGGTKMVFQAASKTS